jgi:ribosomal protein S18 acetylase RimI-like enzyme
MSERSLRPTSDERQPASDFALREYDSRDFDALLRLDRECFIAGIAYSEDELSKFIHARNSFTIVAEDEQGIAGFLVGHVHRRIGWVITLDIHERARRHRLGTRLMQAAEARFREFGATGALLEVAVDNLRAVTFYKRLQYEITRTIPRYYLGTVDAFEMAKTFD